MAKDDDASLNCENKASADAKEQGELVLQTDIYSYTYFKIWVSDAPYQNGELMIKCFFTIFIQLTIIYLRFKEAIEDEKPVIGGTPELNVVKLATAYFMHLQLYPEFEISL